MKLSKGAEKKKRETQHNRCFYCGEDLLFCKIEIDHINPFSIYSDGSARNLCLACFDCNRMKGDKTLKEFFEIVKERRPEKLIRGQFYFQFLNLYHV